MYSVQYFVPFQDKLNTRMQYHNDTHHARAVAIYYLDFDRFFEYSAKFDAKRLISRKFSDPVVQEDMQHWPFKVIEAMPNAEN